MEKNLSITKPSYSEHIFPVPLSPLSYQGSTVFKGFLGNLKIRGYPAILAS